MTLKKILFLFYILAIAGLLSSCSGKSNSASFFRNDVDLNFVTRIAILPFENSSQDQYANQRIRDLAITQVLALGLFDVVDKGITDSVLKDEAVDLKKGPLDQSSMQRVGQLLNVQAFLLGGVNSFGEGRRGSASFPEVTLTMRLIDVHTGTIFWQSTGSRNGDSTAKRFLGLSFDDGFEVSLKLMREMLLTIHSNKQGAESQEEGNDSSPEDIRDAVPAMEFQETDQAIEVDKQG